MSESSQDGFNLGVNNISSPLNSNPGVLQQLTQLHQQHTGQQQLATAPLYPGMQQNQQPAVQPQQRYQPMQSPYPQQPQYNVQTQYQPLQPTMSSYSPQPYDPNSGLGNGSGAPSLNRTTSASYNMGYPTQYPQTSYNTSYSPYTTPTNLSQKYAYTGMGLSPGYGYNSSTNPLVTGQMKTASELVSQANLANQANQANQYHNLNNLNSVSVKDGVKISINMNTMNSQMNSQSRPPAKGKGLMSRVFNSGGFGNGPVPIQPRTNHQPSIPYNQTRSLPTTYSQPRSDRSNNNNNRSRSRSNGKSRGRTIPSEIMDSEDDDFIDERSIDEMSNESDRSDISIGEEVNELIQSSNRLTRKRRREEGGNLLAELNDEHQITNDSLFGDMGEYDWDESGNKRPLTRSRVVPTGGKEPKERKKVIYSKDSDEEDDDSVEDDEEEIEGSGDGSDDEVDESEKREKGKNKLEKLMMICESKVQNMADLLAENGLEYEKLKNTAISVTLDLAEAQPETLAIDCVMTKYQIVGLNWLYLLYKGNLNGILADEMGLGKTLQTISLFTLLKEKDIEEGPHLVVVPSSTLRQWYNEIQRWSPNLRVITYYGTLQERKEIRKQCNRDKDAFDVVLTTYQLVGGKTDKKLFKSIDWHYMVLDEAQNIKNGTSLRFQSLFKIKSKRKLLLTGTPLQNNLQELWSLLHFLMSEQFEKLKIENYSEVFREFMKSNKDDKQIKKKKVTEQDEYIQRLKKILEPFLLRRLKKEVTLDLSEKIHKKDVVEMTDTQLSLYHQIYAHSKSVWAEKQGKQQANARGIVKENTKSNVSLHNFLNNLLMQLRKVSNHPLLLRVYYDDDMIRKIATILMKYDKGYQKEGDNVNDIVLELSASSDWEIHEICTFRKTTITQLTPFLLSDDQVFGISGKMNRLKELLAELKENGHRVLIFSQMTKMMNILGNFFKRENHTFIRLDGSTPVGDRQVLIDRYNQHPDDYFIFLLSTRAGGLGINLSTADTVIFYDIAFNPQVDRQAEDRCHRIGQKKQVNVITLLTKDSCEEQIWEMAHEKKELNDIMLQEGNYSKKIKDIDDNDIIEEKEEELGSDVAMQIALNQIFGAPTNTKEVKVEEKEKGSTSPSKKKFKKDPAEEKKPAAVGGEPKVEKLKVEKVKKTKQPKRESVLTKKKEPSPKAPKKAATPRVPKGAKNGENGLQQLSTTTSTTSTTPNPNLAITLKKPASKLTIVNPNAKALSQITAPKKKEKTKENSDFSDNGNDPLSHSDGPSSSFDDDDEDGDY